MLNKVLEKLFIGIALFFAFFVPGFFLFADQYKSQQETFQLAFINGLLVIIAATLLAIYFKKDD